MFKTNIAKWIDREIHRTELELLRAEDEAQAATLRVKALRERNVRLKGKRNKMPVAELDRARKGITFGGRVWRRIGGAA